MQSEFSARCSEGVLEMDHMGAPFSRTEENKIAQRNFGGQSYPRTGYSADKTGHAFCTITSRTMLERRRTLLTRTPLDLVKSADTLWRCSLEHEKKLSCRTN